MARHRDEASGFARQVVSSADLQPVDALEAVLRAWCAYLPEMSPGPRALEAALITGDEGGEVWRDRMDELWQLSGAPSPASATTASSRRAGRRSPRRTGSGRASSPPPTPTSSTCAAGRRAAHRAHRPHAHGRVGEQPPRLAEMPCTPKHANGGHIGQTSSRGSCTVKRYGSRTAPVPRAIVERGPAMRSPQASRCGSSPEGPSAAPRCRVRVAPRGDAGRGQGGFGLGDDASQDVGGGRDVVDEADRLAGHRELLVAAPRRREQVTCRVPLADPWVLAVIATRALASG